VSDVTDCGGSPQLRRNCGYPGISSADCTKRDCCYDARIPGVNWCFYSQAEDQAQCAVSPSERIDCGYPGISAKDCYHRGCCFNSSVPGVKWCFYSQEQ
ncbi:hypothetical protein GDO81_022210, partial [Engystomops pustulosus]